MMQRTSLSKSGYQYTNVNDDFGNALLKRRIVSWRSSCGVLAVMTSTVTPARENSIVT
jgi:hypothetical protein